MFEKSFLSIFAHKSLKIRAMNIAELKMEMVEIISQTYDEPMVNRATQRRFAKSPLIYQFLFD